MNQVQLSIIIVNYNGSKFLPECIDSIKQHVSLTYEIIIVDNNSTDDSVTYIKNHLDGIKLIESKQNLGFTGGNNLGATSAKGEYILLLNNDTKLLSDITECVDVLKQSPKVGVVGAKLKYGNLSLQASVGYEHSPLRVLLSWLGLSRYSILPSIFRRVETSPSFYDQVHDDVAWVSGACLFTRRILWDACGGLEDSYFMYMEDVDFCKKVRLMGYRVAYTPHVEVIHYEGGGKVWIGEKALLRTVRSYKIYLKKFYGVFSVLWFSFFMSAIFFLRVPFYFLADLLSKSNVYKEKKDAYLRASLKCLSINNEFI